MKPLPQWVSNGAVLGLQGGTKVVRETLRQVEEEWGGNHSNVAAVWLQDWTGQRQFSGKNDIPRVGLWWNWEVGGVSHHYFACIAIIVLFSCIKKRFSCVFFLSSLLTQRVICCYHCLTVSCTCICSM